MRLLSLEVRHWRGLEHRQLEDLSEGLNLIFGPNEAGKSRLFEALRFALFESSKGEAAYKKALAGWSSTESPWVAVELEKDGRRYRVEKRFLKGSTTKLEGGGETLKEEAAEARLRQLLEVGAGGGRGELDPKDRGLWRLLWLSQGESRRAPSDDLNEEPRAALQELLSSEVGEIAAGPAGLRLLERARAESELFWTATGRPKSGGELGTLQQRVADARRARDEASEARETLAREVRELEACRRELEGLDARRSAQLERRRGAEERARAAEAAASELATHRAQQESLELRRRRAAEALEQNRRLGQELAATAEARETLAARRQSLEERCSEAEAATSTAQAAAEAAEAAREEASEARRRFLQAAERRRLEGELGALEKRAAEASEILKALDALERRRGGPAADRPLLERLEKLEREADQARARLEGASARFTLEALASLAVTSKPRAAEEASHRALEAGESMEELLAEALDVEIEGLARISVLPGGEDLSRLRDGVRDRQSSLRETLRQAGFEDLAGAHTRLRELEEIAQEMKTRRALLDRVAPQGVDALRSEVAAAKGRLAALPEGPPPSARDAETSAEDAGRRLEAGLESAEESVRKARAARDGATASLHEVRTELALARQEEERLATHHGALRSQLEGAGPEEDLAREEAALSRQLGDSILRGEALLRSFEAAGGEGASEELKQAQRALERLGEEREALLRRAQTLEGQIAVREGAGLYEKLQEREQELEEVESRLKRVELRAGAARKLVQTLEAQQQAAQQRLAQPVRDRIEPLLSALFPGSTLSLGEDWQVRGLQTAEVEEGFDALSAGAQEQLSVLVRLGLAEIFAAGERLPLILDDALVHTDRDRREAMLRLLGRAAKNLQILVFTCHDEAYDSLGPHKTYRLPPGR
ncbi:MAG: AAA family ATPase [Acidobacteria bacterium]|nr:AAA family ATPase [Acidobacteriota bacterium]